MNSLSGNDLEEIERTGGITMGWRVAYCLDQLLAEVNASAPNRSKVSDGSIGDEDHQNSNSDHNPWCCGWVVTARDITHDPAGGFDSYEYAEWQRQRCRGDILLNGEREYRVKYIISNRKIASPTDNWAWRNYTGDNPHDHHVHISVDCTEEGGYMDSVEPWGWSNDGSATQGGINMLCKYGDEDVNGWGPVTAMQCQGQQCGYNIVSDGIYGDDTARMLVDLNVVGWDTTGHQFGPSEYAKMQRAVAVAAGGSSEGTPPAPLTEPVPISIQGTIERTDQ